MCSANKRQKRRINAIYFVRKSKIKRKKKIMGKKSTKENKNIYQISRENMGFTREKASDALNCISADRIEKIENEKSLPHPDEILAMAECYKIPHLCNYYCSHECPIGQRYVPEVLLNDLSQIVLQMLASLNSLNKKKERLIEITANGEVSDDELHDFVIIQNELENISITAEALQLWFETTIANNQIDIEKLEAVRREIL